MNNVVSIESADGTDTELAHILLHDESHANFFAFQVASYIYTTLQQDPSRNCFDFISNEFSVLYKYSLKYPDSYRKLRVWSRTYADDLRRHHELRALWSEERLSLYNGPDSLHNLIVGILSLITPIDKVPYNEPRALKLLLDILSFFTLVHERKQCLSRDECEMWMQGIGILSPKHGDRTVAHAQDVFNKTVSGNREMQILLEKYPLITICRIFAQVTLWRLPIFKTKEHLEQFLFEDCDGILVSENGDSYHRKICEKIKHVINLIKDRQPEIMIDTPSGSQLTARSLSYSFENISHKIAQLVQITIVEIIFDLYCNLRGRSCVVPADIKILKENELQILNGLLKKYPSLHSVLAGNNYRDTYEYASQTLQNRHQREIIDTTKSFVEFQHDMIEQQNSEIGILKKDKGELKEENSRLSTSVSELKSENRDLTELFEASEEDVKQRQLEIDALSADRIWLQSQTDWMSAALLSKQSGLTLDETEGILVLRCLTGNQMRLKPVDCLRILQTLGGSRVIILPDAYKSAERINREFQNGARLMGMLAKLASDYFDLFFTQGDTAARKVFSSQEYSANESETTKNTDDPSVWADRSVLYRNKAVKMIRHLKIGVSNDDRHSLRIYFFIDNDDKKIVIGYCGPHPKLKSFS